jgi:hypothetical protein
MRLQTTKPTGNESPADNDLATRDTFSAMLDTREMTEAPPATAGLPLAWSRTACLKPGGLGLDFVH